MGRVRAAYTAAEKLAAVKYAEAHGNRAAGRVLRVSEACIRGWRKQKARLQTLPKTKKAERGTKPGQSEVEMGVLEWVCDRRTQDIATTAWEIRLAAMVLAKERSIPFKPSVSWSYEFKKRNGLSVRRQTHVEQKVPEVLGVKLQQPKISSYYTSCEEVKGPF